jgi:hypothetical protein
MKSAAISLVILLALALIAAGATQAQKDPKAGDQKGGVLSGTKKVGGTGAQGQGLTATGGTKGLDGASIGEAQPASADRAKVTAMENYSIPEPDLKQFQADGKLIPAK